MPAGDVEWSCRLTLDHIADALTFYAAHLATRATERRIFSRDGDPRASIAEIFCVIEAGAAILTECIRAAPTGTRAWHSFGVADPDGFAAMGCDELLVHTGDISRGLGISFDPPRDLCDRVVRRLFPWAPVEGDPWELLQWANGRLDLPGRVRLGPDWTWHCAPLNEWNGQILSR